MHIGLVIGKDKSTGVKGKNVRKILGRPLAEYAFIAAKHSKIDQCFVSTDSQEIGAIGARYGATLIERPCELATPQSLTEDVLRHAYEQITQRLSPQDIQTISLLFCNNPMIDVRKLDEAIGFLEKDEEYDSCFSVAKYDMFTPLRARKISAQGEILPFVELSHFENVTSIRDGAGSTYFCDLSIQCMKPRCLTHMEEGRFPFQWQGRKSKAIEVDFGFDIDSEWQMVVAEHWLKSHGFTEQNIGLTGENQS